MNNRRSSFRSVTISTLLIPIFASGALAATGVCDLGGPPNTIEVEASAGTAQAGYPTLAAAFAAINAGTHRGTIAVEVCGDTSEPAAGAPLNASGSGSGSYASISIKPIGGAARSISGAATAGLPLIDLRDADNVTIDGIGSGGNSLTISNTRVSATAETSTIRFFSGASNNVVKNASILGSFSGPVQTAGGTIYFRTGTGAFNNSANTIANCNIGPAGPDLPTKAIHATGFSNQASNTGTGIVNNNIYDFFGASANSAGIYGNVNVNWTISNNRFYQTATRTWTAPVTHRPIELLNVENFIINGNIIGFGNAGQTGTYALTGSAGIFSGINFAGQWTGGLSRILSNTIASISVTGVSSTGFGGIAAHGNVEVSNNTIGSQSSTGSLVFSTNTSAATQVTGISTSTTGTGKTCSGNNLGGILADNASGPLTITGISAYSTYFTTASSNVVGGTVENSIQNLAASAGSEVTGLTSREGDATITGNTIRNLTSTGGSVTGLSRGPTGNITVSQNTIFNLARSSATPGGSVTGMRVEATSAVNKIVARNFVHSLTTAGTSGSSITGLYFGGGVCQNNMIALGSGVPGDVSIMGIHDSSGGTGDSANSFYFNSVYIGGSAVDGSTGTFAFRTDHQFNTSACKNNIFVNARSNGSGTGKHYAIDDASLGSVGLISDYNVLHVSGQGGTVGRDAGVDFATLADWQASTGRDLQSFSDDPRYAGPTQSPPNLHIGAGPTVVERRGTAISGIADDFDGEARQSLSPTDIGADAGNFTPTSEPTGPVISYAPLPNDSNVVSRALNISVTDESGVPTAGLGLPVLYFRKVTGPYSATTCSWTSGSEYVCTFQYSAIGGVVSGNVISFYVAAQDSLGNVAVNPPTGATGLTANPPAAGTPPTPPNGFTINAPISGAVTVCATGCDYSTLTGAGGAFASINATELNGNLDILIAGDLVSGETGVAALNRLAEDPPDSNYSVRIYPIGTARAITSTTAPFAGFIRLDGTSRVTIDGSLGGVGTDRSLTVTGTGTSTSSTVVSLGDFNSSYSTFNTIKNLIVIGTNGATTEAGIYIECCGAAYNTIQNNDVRRAQWGIIASFGENNVITRNVITATGANSVTKGAIALSFEDYAQVTENHIDGISQSGSAVFGIGVGQGSVTTGSNPGTECIDAMVARNVIGMVRNTGSGSAVGIAVAAASSGTTTIVNNMIHGVAASATSNRIGVGIFIGGGAGSVTRVYHNSVSMTGALTGGTYPNYGLVIDGVDPVVDLRNNAFLNTLSNGGGFSYAIGTASSAFTNLTANTNVFYVPPGGGAFRIGKTGGLAPGTGVEHVLLSSWQAATGKDLASIAAIPGFVSTTDLHIASPGPKPVEDAGTPLAAVAIDIDGESRNTLHPDVGADEIDRCAGVTCQGGDDVCVANTCNAADGLCGLVYLPATTICRSSVGECDLAETCTGADATCPGDAKRTDTCRPAAGPCDAAEVCDGGSTACPPDVVGPAGMECRNSAGECDHAESCDGIHGACPADVFLSDATECRASTDTCDPAEYCSGVGATCPQDVDEAGPAVGNSLWLGHDRSTAVSTLTWTEADTGPFNAYRGSLLDGAAWAYNQSCLAHGLTVAATTDAMTPDSGELFFYLISRAVSTCGESGLGFDSSGVPRPNPVVCP